jgi:hypothetical protein
VISSARQDTQVTLNQDVSTTLIGCSVHITYLLTTSVCFGFDAGDGHIRAEKKPGNRISAPFSIFLVLLRVYWFLDPGSEDFLVVVVWAIGAADSDTEGGFLGRRADP